MGNIISSTAKLSSLSIASIVSTPHIILHALHAGASSVLCRNKHHISIVKKKINVLLESRDGTVWNMSLCSKKIHPPPLIQPQQPPN